MASFYSSEGDQMLPSEYLLNYKLSSLQSSKHTNNDTNKLFSNSRKPFGPTIIDPIDRPLNFNHGLSLSLGSREQPASFAHISSDSNEYVNSSFFSFLNSTPHNNKNLNDSQNVSFDLARKNCDSVEFEGPVCNFQGRGPGVTVMACGSKYLEAARDLLDELVSVRGVTKGPEKAHYSGGGLTGRVVGPTGGDVNRPAEGGARGLSVVERPDLQTKVTKLVSLLNEVDRSYIQYRHQIRALASSFDTAVGPGSSLPYTSLARRSISRQFRSLHDAIKRQIESAQQSLGEQVTSSPGGGILSRLSLVDRQMRRQTKAVLGGSFGHHGLMRQPWRPQRGLPEKAVTILRAWLFEHFLHPYPKDSEKIVLARETGLTRSQVANWFINARVRLWKPMIEEMYKEEFGGAENEPKSSPEHAQESIPSFNERGEGDFSGSSLISPLIDETRRVQPYGPDMIRAPEVELASYPNYVLEGEKATFGSTQLGTKFSLVSGSGDTDFRDDLGYAEGIIGNQVSLALGLRQSKKDPKPSVGDEIQLSGNEYYYVGPIPNNSKFTNAGLFV